MRTAGEGGLSLVFASRAAVPRPPARHTAAMLLAGCTSVCIVAVPVPCGRNDGIALCTSRLQLRLADGKSLLGVNSARSAVTDYPTISSSAIHLREQTLLQGHTGHICRRVERKGVHLGNECAPEGRGKAVTC